MTYTPIQITSKGAARILSAATYASIVVVALIAMTGGCGSHGGRPAVEQRAPAGASDAPTASPPSQAPSS